MKLRRPDKYEHQILGGWLSKAEGTIIRNWRVADYFQTEISCYGQDFGFSVDPTTLVKISADVEMRKLYVKEVYGLPNLSTAQIATRNRNECGLDLIICDSAEPRLINELKKYGNNIKPAIKKKGSILSGIALLQDYEIIVDRRSNGIIKELNNYVWADKNQKPIDTFNHFIDAMRYAAQHLLQGQKSGQYVVR
jgi:phage terminase large subunit